MRLISRLGILAIFSLLGCRGDQDGDGLNAGQERRAGTNRDLADTDGDGLRDGAEVERGTDPLEADTDGDGYTDRDEVFEGTDPLDADSRIYQGGWPYRFDKSDIPADAGIFAEEGRTFLRLRGIDQYGDTVDLYDLYNEDVPIVIDVSAQWCPFCNELGASLAGFNDSIDQRWPGGREHLEAGTVLWVTILSEGTDNRASTPTSVQEWHAEYPANHIVMTDDNYAVADYIGLTGWPRVHFLDPDLGFVPGYGLNVAAQRYP